MILGWLRRACAVLIVLQLWAPALALADVDPAKDLFDEGRRLFDGGKIDEACEVLGRSLQLVRTAGTLINLARCHAEQGKTALAWREYREVEDMARAAGQQDRAEGAAQLAEALEPRLGKLRIEVGEPVDGVTIMHNGEVWAGGTAGSWQRVDPGRQRVEAIAPGSLPWQTTIDLDAGEEATIRIPSTASDSGPAIEPASTDDGGEVGVMFTAGIVVGAVGVVAVIAGGVLGGVTLSEVGEAEQDDALCGADKACTPAGLDHVQAAETKGIASTVLLGVGVAGLAVGATLVILGLDSEADAALVAPWIAPGVAGLAWSGRF
jgi:hypothetical protein